jgi:hypothetical protein
MVLAQTGILIAMLEMPRRYLCENLAKLAKIQDSKRRMFDEHASKALRTWFCSVILDIGSSSTAPILGGMKRNLTDVCEKLRGLSGLKLSLECGTTEFSLAGVVDDLKKILGVIERTLPRGHDRGRPAGIRQYPELDALVYHLEFSAQLAGGKFTVHKKNGGKGTIIEALNLLRNVMLARGEKLAAAIPLPAKHPISTYVRAINEARKAAAATLGLAGPEPARSPALPASTGLKGTPTAVAPSACAARLTLRATVAEAGCQSAILPGAFAIVPVRKRKGIPVVLLLERPTGVENSGLSGGSGRLM